MNKRIEFGSLFQIGFYLVHVGHDCQHGPIRKKAPLEWGLQFVNRGLCLARLSVTAYPRDCCYRPGTSGCSAVFFPSISMIVASMAPRRSGVVGWNAFINTPCGFWAAMCCHNAPALSTGDRAAGRRTLRAQPGAARIRSAFGGKADSLAHDSACPLIAKSGHTKVTIRELLL